MKNILQSSLIPMSQSGGLRFRSSNGTYKDYSGYNDLYEGQQSTNSMYTPYSKSWSCKIECSYHRVSYWDSVF